MNNIQVQRADAWGYLVRCDQEFVASVAKSRNLLANKRIIGELTITR